MPSLCTYTHRTLTSVPQLPTHKLVRYAECPSVCLSPRLALSNMHWMMHSIASSARGSIHAHKRHGHSLGCRDTTYTGKAQTTSYTESMTQRFSLHDKWLQSQRRRASPLPQAGRCAAWMAFIKPIAMRHCRSLPSCLIIHDFLL